MKELRMFWWAISIAAAVVLVLAPDLSGTPEMANVEDRNCVTCHTAFGRPELNEIGQYYKAQCDEGECTLEGYAGEMELPEREPEPGDDEEPALHLTLLRSSG
jgi:hypothetical protein